MNPSDDDLNCLLKAWTVPQSPDSLEGRLRRAYRDRTRSQKTLGLVEVSPALWAEAEGRQLNRGPVCGSVGSPDSYRTQENSQELSQARLFFWP